MIEEQKSSIDIDIINNNSRGGGHKKYTYKIRVYLLCCAIVFLVWFAVAVVLVLDNSKDDPVEGSPYARCTGVIVNSETHPNLNAAVPCNTSIGSEFYLLDLHGLTYAGCSIRITAILSIQHALSNTCSFSATLHPPFTIDLDPPIPGAFSVGHVANWEYLGPVIGLEYFEMRAGGATWTVPATERSSVWTGRGIEVGRHMLQIRSVGNDVTEISSAWVDLGYVVVLSNPGNPGLNGAVGQSEGIGVRRDVRLWYDRVLL